MNTLFLNIYRWFEIDYLVRLALIAKLFGLCSAPITLILIVQNLTPELQGYYYTFASVLSLQGFVELGLGAVLIQFSAHEWAHLSLNRKGFIVGNIRSYSRLSSLLKISIKWYRNASVLILFFIGVGGAIFFNQSGSNLDWFGPWILVTIVSSLTILTIPILSIIEGCNFLEKLYKLRLIQGLTASLILWVSILMDLGLWSIGISGLCVLLITCIVLYRNFQNFFIALFKIKNFAYCVSWKQEIFPMQWRVALGTISSFFLFSFFVPISFKYLGPEVAGQMGMTMTLIMAIGNFSFVWFSPKMSLLAQYAAKESFGDLDKLFFKTTKVTSVILILISIIFVALVYLANVLDLKIANRILPLNITLIFLISNIVGFASAPFSYYMRAFKKEPIAILGFIGSMLIGVSTYIFAKQGSLYGVSISALLVNSSITLGIIYIWNLHRNKVLNTSSIK